MQKGRGNKGLAWFLLILFLAGCTSLAHGGSFAFEGRLSGSLDLGAGAVGFVDNPFTLTGALVDVMPDANEFGFIAYFQSTSKWHIAGLGVFEGDVGASYFTQSKNLFSLIGFSSGTSLSESILSAASLEFSIADINVFEPQPFTTSVRIDPPNPGIPAFGGIVTSASLSNASGHSLSIVEGEVGSAVSAIPLPATAWLLGAALLALVSRKRRRT